MCYEVTIFVSCLLAMALFLIHPPATLVAMNNLDDNPNYPATYYHANYREYVDLSFCAWDDTLDDFDVYSCSRRCIRKPGA